MKVSGKYKLPVFFVSGILVILIILCMLLGIRVARVRGNSMQPAASDGQYILYRSRFAHIGRGDVILFKKEKKWYIKRVYGLPGDTVEVTGQGTVLINGEPPEIRGLKIMGETRPYDMAGEITLSDAEYFVLGDHRTMSKDSRHEEIGNVSKEEIKGVALIHK